MKVKFTLLGACLLTFFSASFYHNDGVAFTYTYQIRANSYQSKDELRLYSVKEKLIETYEKICFGYAERYHQDILKLHLEDFRFSSDIKPYYQNGRIILTIGSGLGYTIQGTLRKNECDGNVIREKIYFFEFFS